MCGGLWEVLRTLKSTSNVSGMYSCVLTILLEDYKIIGILRYTRSVYAISCRSKLYQLSV